MKSPRVDVGKIRRQQVIEAAVAVIAEQGLPRLSLSAIEKRAGMSRGQLTYYFRSKEDILLAVFDRLLEMMHAGARGCGDDGAGGWERLRQLLGSFVLHPPEMPEFHVLQHTFLAESGHREDYRGRLAALYEGWREHLANDLAHELAPKAASPRTFSTFVQALLHGLAVQRAADPDAYDRQEMLELCLDVLGGYLGRPARARPSSKAPAANGAARRGRKRPPSKPRR